MNTIIEKIRAEVNRQARSIDTATGDFAEGRRMEQRIILSVLSDLEKECEEKPTNIDFEQELYKHFGQVKDFTLGMQIGKYFYNLGKQSKQPESEGLEEASQLASEVCYPLENFSGSRRAYRKGFIAGAKWQKDKDAKKHHQEWMDWKGVLFDEITKAESHGYHKGVEDGIIVGKEQMEKLEAQNHQWSEEDEEMLNSAIGFVEHSAFTTIGKGKKNVLAWLKSFHLKVKSEKPMNPACESKFKVGDVIQFKDGTNQYKICGVFSDHYINSIGNRMDMYYTDANFELVEHPVCEGLEEEMDKFFETMPVLEHENIFEDTFKNIARHFAQWGAEHLKK